MTRYLTIYVRAHEGRYHGGGDDLPSPFRLFQALVSGAGISGPLDDRTKQALVWLEALPDAPLVASPRLARGQAVTMFVPNNDLDKFGGDARNIAKTRGAQKVWRPRHFDASVPWIYAWPFANVDEGDGHARAICALADKLYQLGRGVDMAWAWADIRDEAELQMQLAAYNGVVRRPRFGDGIKLACPTSGDGIKLACPSAGSFASLSRRYSARRFRSEDGQRVFVQPPKPSFRQVLYDAPPAHQVFELRSSRDSERRLAWPLEEASALVVSVRDAARARLSAAMPNLAVEIDRALLGRTPDGANAVPVDARVRIVAIPSIGMQHADRAIRRVLVEIPASCRISRDDLRWAFSGAELFDPQTGEAKEVFLTPSADDAMLRHYAFGATALMFRSVTPLVLPEDGKRRRIEPTRMLAEAKGGLERYGELSAAKAAVVQALRYADVGAPAESIRLQREPFDGAGSRAESFAAGTRFEKERLWHVEIAFAVPVGGPLLLGDGRFLGLGLMAPVRDVVLGAHAFAIGDGLVGQPEPLDVARALRRAVMARVQATLGAGEHLAPFFSGHAEDGTPVRRSRSSHLSFAYEPEFRRLLILAPHAVERRAPTPPERNHLRILHDALQGFCVLRAGRAGAFSLSPAAISEVVEPLLGPSRVWKTITPYVVTRHGKRGAATEAVVDDVGAECRRLGLPAPRVDLSDVRGAPGIGLTANVTLRFERCVTGPLLLGRTRHFGGGLFRPVEQLDHP